MTQPGSSTEVKGWPGRRVAAPSCDSGGSAPPGGRGGERRAQCEQRQGGQHADAGQGQAGGEQGAGPVAQPGPVVDRGLEEPPRQPGRQHRHQGQRDQPPRRQGGAEVVGDPAAQDDDRPVPEVDRVRQGAHPDHRRGAEDAHRAVRRALPAHPEQHGGRYGGQQRPGARPVDVLRQPERHGEQRDEGGPAQGGRALRRGRRPGTAGQGDGEQRPDAELPDPGRGGEEGRARRGVREPHRPQERRPDEDAEGEPPRRGGSVGGPPGASTISSSGQMT